MTLNMYILNRSFLFVKIVVRRFASHAFDASMKKMKTSEAKKDKRMVKFDLFFQNCPL